MEVWLSIWKKEKRWTIERSRNLKGKEWRKEKGKTINELWYHLGHRPIGGKGPSHQKEAFKKPRRVEEVAKKEIQKENVNINEQIIIGAENRNPKKNDTLESLDIELLGKD